MGALLVEHIHVNAVRNVCNDVVKPSLVMLPQHELDRVTSRPSLVYVNRAGGLCETLSAGRPVFFERPRRAARVSIVTVVGFIF
jgi:hypothetical protein